MFCSNCGKEIAAGIKFCTNCGKKIAQNSAVQQPAASIQQDEPENILLKAMVTAKEVPSNGSINNGHLIITNKRVVYRSSRFLNTDLLGSDDSALSINYNEIAEFRMTTYNLVFPAIEITTKYGHKIKFGGYGKIKKVYEIICEKMRVYA
jgi:hypothetical protein